MVRGRPIRQSFSSGLVIIAAGALASCGDRSETDTGQEFVTAFNEGTLADHKYGLFSELLSGKQLRTLTELSERCSIDEDTLTVVNGFVSPTRKTMGAVALCGDEKYSVITGVNVGCSNVAGDCGDDYRVDPVGLPGGSSSGRIKNTSLPAEIRELDPLEPTTN